MILWIKKTFILVIKDIHVMAKTNRFSGFGASIFQQPDLGERVLIIWGMLIFLQSDGGIKINKKTENYEQSLIQ